MRKYVFRKYNPEYRPLFVQEKLKIVEILGTGVSVEHMGSTAVPGLGGKGIIDIIIGVSKSEMKTAKDKLEGAGYEFREKASCPERFFFRIDYPHKNNKRRVHIHLTEFNGKKWKGLLGFRDYLLSHPEAVEEYIKIKKEAVDKALGDGEIYRKHKKRFIDDILEV